MSKPIISTETGVKRILGLLGLLILAPLVMSFGVKALRVFANTPKILLAYFLVGLGIILIIFTVYFGIKTFKTILDIIFKN